MAASAGCLLPGAGCAGPTPARAVRYDIRVSLDPATHRLQGQTAVRLRPIINDDSPPDRPVVVEFELHSALNVTGVDCDSARISERSARPKATPDGPGSADSDDEDDAPRQTGGDGQPAPVIHRIVLREPPEEFTVTVDYAGALVQDPSAGEKRGAIHNFAMTAHVGPDGIYLSDTGGWYPALAVPDDAGPEISLADYALAVDPVPGTQFVAGLEPIAGPAGDGTLRWRSARPVAGVTLTGGDRVRVSAEHEGVTLHAVVSRGKEHLAGDLLQCARGCFDRYAPLVGPYPFSDFTMLESFFSSGFAFPGFTQFTPVILSDKKPYWRHGYLDHEFLHNWFGNGVYVDPGDGNWCEALTSFCANLYGYELDGDAEGARRQRRNKCHFLSRVKPEKDKPLGTFGLPGGAGRPIGYDKGCMVFHMLNETMGGEAFWAGVRRLTTDYLGNFADWNDLKVCFAAETDRDLDRFFQQWVRTAGAPELAVRSAVFDPQNAALELTITQGPTAFALDVPIRVYESDDRFHDVVVPITAREQTVRSAVEGSTPPAFIELDPDYHLFRKVPENQILPTSSLTRYGKKLVIVQPDGDLWENYELVASDFEAGNGADHTTVVSVTKLSPDSMTDTGVLILGTAVLNPWVHDLLSRAGCPVTWESTGFRIGDTTYAKPGHAVFVTLRHPDDPARGITVYYGNSKSALANAGILGYYADSLLVFETGTAAPGTTGAGPATEVVHREDLETRVRVPVTNKQIGTDTYFLDTLAVVGIVWGDASPRQGRHSGLAPPRDAARQQPPGRFLWRRQSTRLSQLLREQAARFGFEVLAYCLMTNHVHLVGIPQNQEPLARAAGWTPFGYTQHVNRLHGRCGPLWQNRFSSCTLDELRRWRAVCYVERNPIRARLVRAAWRYPWSSAAAHTGQADPSGLLDLRAWWQQWDANRRLRPRPGGRPRWQPSSDGRKSRAPAKRGA